MQVSVKVPADPIAGGGSITDVAGVKVGHYTDPRRPTGCTVVLLEEGAVGGVDVRGAAPGTRETDLLSPGNTIQTVHAVLLSGGSAFGLDAAGGVVRWLADRGIGVSVGGAVVPIVPAAILFDLQLGNPAFCPDARGGQLACEAASSAPPVQGSVGAGAGATVGKLWGMDRAMRGGIGSAAVKVDGVTVGALVAVNAIGDVIDPTSGAILAGARKAADSDHCIGTTAALLAGERPGPLCAGSATTLGVVATDMALDKAQCRRLAQCAHDGLARSIDPVHSAFDGDTVFALATGRTAAWVHPVVLAAAAAQVMAQAVVNAVNSASGLEGAGLPRIPARIDLRGGRA